MLQRADPDIVPGNVNADSETYAIIKAKLIHTNIKFVIARTLQGEIRNLRKSEKMAHKHRIDVYSVAFNR